jgi:hypothetical protein
MNCTHSGELMLAGTRRPTNVPRIRAMCRVGLYSLLISFAQSCLADQWVLDLTPTQVITGPTTGNGQYIQLLVSGTVLNPAGCPTTDSYISEWAPSSTLATLLSALMAGKLVRIYISSTACDSWNGRPSFTIVGIEG